MQLRAGLWLTRLDSLLGLVMDAVGLCNTRGRQAHLVTNGFRARLGRGLRNVSIALAVA